MPKNPAEYTADSIKTLDPMEHIRLRTGMYIGRKGDGAQYEDGIYILLKEVLDNAIDEFIMGYGKRIVVKLDYATGEVSVRDYGRGIPLEKVVACVSEMNTGGKYNDDVFQFSVGMNGVGTKAVNALSERFTVRSTREGRFVEATFAKGKLLERKEGETKERNGTFMGFLPDVEIFPKFAFRAEHVARRLKMYAYLNAGLTIELNGEPVRSENGLMDLIGAEADGGQLYGPFHFRSKMLEVAFTHTNHMGEEYYSFVNGQYTNDGGTHLTAFKEGFLRGVQEFSKKRYDGDVARDGIIAAVAIRLKDPVFESQTKNKLGNPEIRAGLVAEIKKVVEDELHRHPEDAQRLLDKIDETAKLRAASKDLQKTIRERAKQSAVRVEELIDCKRHLDKAKGKGEDTMIFLVEGKSAGGTVGTARDTQTPGQEPGHRAVAGQPALRQGHPGDGRGCGRPAYPQPAHHLLPALLRPHHQGWPPLHPGDPALPRAQRQAELLLLRRRRARGCHQGLRRQGRDHPLQGPRGDQRQGVQGLHRRGHPPDPRGCAQRHARVGHRAVPHGREHPRAPPLHLRQPLRGQHGLLRGRRTRGRRATGRPRGAGFSRPSKP